MSTNKKVEVIINNKIEILELKGQLKYKKTLLEGFNNIFEQAYETIDEFEDKSN